MLEFVRLQRFCDGSTVDRASNDTSLLLLLERLVLFVGSATVPREDDLVGVGEDEERIGRGASAEADSLTAKPSGSGLA